MSFQHVLCVCVCVFFWLGGGQGVSKIHEECEVSCSCEETCVCHEAMPCLQFRLLSGHMCPAITNTIFQQKVAKSVALARG